MTSFINTITSKKWGNGGSPGATPLTSPANGTEPAPGAALRGPMGGNSTANGTGGQHAANGSGGGGASVEQLGASRLALACCLYYLPAVRWLHQPYLTCMHGIVSYDCSGAVWEVGGQDVGEG